MSVKVLLIGEGVQTIVQALEEGTTNLSWPLLRGPRSRGALKTEIIKRNFVGVINDVVLIVNDNSI